LGQLLKQVLEQRRKTVSELTAYVSFALSRSKNSSLVNRWPAFLAPGDKKLIIEKPTSAVSENSLPSFFTADVSRMLNGSQSLFF